MYKTFKINDNLFKINDFYIGVEKNENTNLEIHRFIDELGYEGVSTDNVRWFWKSGDYKIVFTTNNEIIKAPLFDVDERFSGCGLLEVIVEYYEITEHLDCSGGNCTCRCHLEGEIIRHVVACCKGVTRQGPKVVIDGELSIKEPLLKIHDGKVVNYDFNTEVIKYKYYSLYSNYINEEGVLELTEPSSLSDENYIKLSTHLINIIGLQDAINSDLKNICKEFICNYYEVGCLHNLPSSLIDELRMMGCITPWWMLGVDKILSLGWVKLK